MVLEIKEYLADQKRLNRSDYICMLL